MANGYIKEMDVTKGLRGKVRKFQISCMYKKEPNLTETRDTCRNCKNQNPRTEIVVPSGRTEHEENGDVYRCGIPIKLIVNIGEKGLPQLTQNIDYRGGVSKSIIPTTEPDRYFYSGDNSHEKWGI